MSKEHSVIIIPGLGDGKASGTKMLELATNHWRKYGLEPIVHTVGWRDGEDLFQPKLDKLVELVDQLTKKGDVISLVGTSAGGSAALNAFVERRDVIHRVINVCGRLRTGPTDGFRSFESKTASSPTFARSVKLFESREHELSESDRMKVMTIRAMFGDELVPPETTVLSGALNTRIPTPEHVFSIGMALTLLSKPTILFLKGENRR